MTVKELIESLSKIEDQETRVMIRGYEGGYNDVVMIDNTPAIVNVALDVNEEWYYGAHERVGDVDRDTIGEYTIVKAMLM
jgi:hypothetical protein